MPWPELPAHVLVAQAGDQWIAVDTCRATTVHLSPMLGLLLGHRDQFSSLHAAAELCSEEFGVDRVLVETELRAAVDHLDGLVGRCSEPADLFSYLPEANGSVPHLDHSLVVDALGAPVEVRSAPALASMVGELLSSLPAARTPAQHRLDVWTDQYGSYSLSVDGRLMCDDPDHHFVMSNLVSTITALAMRAPRAGIALHASSASVGGQTVIMAGASGAGKSSTVTELTRRGATYHTDELVELSVDDWSVRGLCRPIGLEGVTHHLFPELIPPDWTPGSYDRWLVHPDRLGRHSPDGQEPQMAILAYDPTVTAPRPLQLNMVDGLAALIGNVTNLGEFDLQRLQRLIDFVERRPVLSVVHGGAESAAQAIETLYR